jgi:hypothetical protein
MNGTKCLSCGDYNIYFKYILFTILFGILNNFLYGYNLYHPLFIPIKIFSEGAQKYLPNHYLIHAIFQYIGTFFFSFFYYRYEKYISTRDLKNKTSIFVKQESSAQIVLIHNVTDNNIEDKVLKTKNLYYQYIMITILWIIEEHLLLIYLFAFKDLDFWMLELLIITYISARMFKLQTYNHHKVAILFNIFPCILKIITIILSFNENNQNEGVSYTESASLVVFGISIYLVLITLRSYVNSKIKWFMDLQYISPNRLLMIFGLLGTIICSITCVITTIFKCKEYKIFGGSKDISDDICRVNNTHLINSTENYNTYFDNFLIYYSSIKNKSDFFKELFIIVAGMITYFYSQYNCLMVIKYLTPVYIIFSIPIYYFIQKIILIVNTLIQNHSFFYEKDDGIRIKKFTLDISGDILSIIGFLFYLEIIEINICNLNYNLRKSIMKRAYFESYKCERISSMVSSEIELQDKSSELDITSNI